MSGKNHYYAFANNDQGVQLDVCNGTSINECAIEARRILGSGWKVHIMKKDADEQTGEFFGTTEVKTFTIR